MKVHANHFPLIVIVVCLPFILWAVGGILPTFDDYTSLQSPWWVQIADPGYFFPDSVRRPFDALLGAIVGWKPVLFPTLNHVLIILGHTASAGLVYALCQRLKLGTLAANVATLFFFFSPATLGATLACDGFNQTYAQLWGLLALWCYLKTSGRGLLWLLCVIMAVLSKENGLAWAVVPPVIGYAFHLSSRREALHHIGYGLIVAAAYFIIYGVIYFSGILGIEYDEQYTDTTIISHLKDFLQLIAYTWIPVDYASIVYPPARNWTIVAMTALASLPFLILLAARWRLLKTRSVLLLVICFLILTAPHLLTVVSIMHNYAALSIAALIVAALIEETKKRQFLIPAFGLFLAAALFTDVHHYQAARQSGLLGRQLAMQAITQAQTPLERVFCININNEQEPCYSNFYVRPVDAFAWGLSVRHYTGYTWKTAISETTLPRYNQGQIETLADSALQAGNDAVWVVGHDKEKLTIITPQ